MPAGARPTTNLVSPFTRAGIEPSSRPTSGPRKDDPLLGVCNICGREVRRSTRGRCPGRPDPSKPLPTPPLQPRKARKGEGLTMTTQHPDPRVDHVLDASSPTLEARQLVLSPEGREALNTHGARLPRPNLEAAHAFADAIETLQTTTDPATYRQASEAARGLLPCVRALVETLKSRKGEG